MHLVRRPAVQVALGIPGNSGILVCQLSYSYSTSSKIFVNMQGSIVYSLLIIALLLGQPFPLSAQRGRNRDKKEETVKTIDPRTRTRLDMLYVDACTEMIRGDLPAARQLFLKLLEEDTENHAALYNLGKMAFEERMYDDAIQYGSTALEKDPSNYWYYHLLEKAYEEKGNFAKAIEVQEQLTARFPAQVGDRLLLADLYIRNKESRRAIEQLRQIEAERGVSEETAFLMYGLYMNQNRPEEALAVTEKLLNINDREERFYQMAYTAQMKAGNPEAAAEVLLQLLEKDTENGFALLTLTGYYQQRNEPAKAEAFMDRAFENPEVPAADKVKVLREMMAETDASGRMPRINKLTAMLRLYHPEMAETYALQGEVFTLNQQLDSAYWAYDRSLSLQPADIQVWIRLLKSLSGQEKYGLLLDRADEAREYYPNDGEILFYTGLGYARTGQAKSAIRSLERVTRAATSGKELVAQAYGELGRISLSEGALEEAESKLVEATNRLQSPELLELYGDVLMEQGKKDAAMQQWKKALEVGGEKTRIEPKMQGQ